MPQRLKAFLHMSCNNKYDKPYHLKHKETLTFVRLSNFEERKEDYFA